MITPAKSRNPIRMFPITLPGIPTIPESLKTKRPTRFGMGKLFPQNVAGR